MKKSAITSGGASLLEILVCTATAGAFMKKSAITSGGEGLIKGFSWYAYPAGASFCDDKRMQKRFRAAP